MKALLLALTLVSTAAVAAPIKEVTLANPDDFVIVSDVEQNEIELFLSYTGEHFNHCGIKLRTHSWGGGGQSLVGILTIEGGDDVRIENGRLVATVSPKEMGYGRFFKIKTKSGESLKDAITNLNPNIKVDVIAEIRHCH